MRDRIRARTLIELDQNDALQGSRKGKESGGDGGVLPWGAQITQRCSSWWWWWKWIVHPPSPILIAGWHSEGRSSQAEDAVHAAIHHSVEHLISLFGPGPRRLAAHHIKDNSVLKGIKVMCQLLQLDKWVNYVQQLPPPFWNANRGDWRRGSVP